MEFFKLLTPITYWILIIFWSYILWFYLTRLRTGKIRTSLTITLLIILSIEAFRTLFESLYFGAWYTSLQGLLPKEVHLFLVQPNFVIIPKLLNVFAAVTIIVILIRRWLPQEQAHGAEQNLMIEKQTKDLLIKNELLSNEIARRETIEQQLSEHRDHLESIVESRTEELASSNEQLKREIDERKLIEKSLDKAYLELDQIFNSAAIGIRVIDNNHNVLRVNDNLLEITGESREEIMKKECSELFGGAICHTVNCTLQRIKTGIRRHEAEIETVTKEGKVVPYLVTGAPYYDVEGQRVGVIESYLNISNIKKIEKAVKEERDLFMEGVVVVFKWKNTESWTVDYVSPNVSNILGYHPDEFLNEKIQYKDIIDENDLPRVIQKKTECLNDGTEYLEHAPYRLRHRNGKLIWVLDYTRFVRNQDGEVEFLHGYIIDISLYKATEEKLENQEQLAHTGRLSALGEMASGMAHELNQPMTVIRLAADGLKMYFDFKEPDTAESESVDDIITQVKRAAKIIKNMRSFSHPKSELVRPVDISEPIEDALSFFNEQFRIHQIQIKRSIEKDLPKVEVDPQKFEQIVVNLLSNARYAVEKKNEYAGHEYSMEVDIRLYLSENKDYVIFKVRDNGIGMSPEVVQRCMEPFFTTKDIGDGTGLGLSIIHGIVKEFDMKIEITSEAEEFCMFVIRIPILETSAE
ncbi:MAG: PAS domain S-box protein [Deltaproteobacteria bacterium]|jgi:PAS domain S-box-containing protein|nr:PAS domain S-box protein [Deltaproteobacteria bacterium]MBT4091797.1 PAS domain S-box protein [Deltaproteobacteria bacterium]MBT4267781.1 PAS domain S-box protein [Deltaproteobacteria bacterium]MBT4644571.1 PAS domain S-box protein [Deltaproteobacteria bacterium]MBT6614950.1 PAS domain S-box protein [Deltaproteobacteria bacterium]